ncbi:MAG: 30S ribosomal protein S1 [Desulfobacula sp.]|jgi:small subunit ribosomal protein S1|uniref:30S ribosomal protein S1 n=1 Tax=Desulfobacula sp. TaxID=2593537 RepID=UPI001D70EDF5|nr:30S ribosomal protein S1 [Desulfobacula sp.]MBT3487348.1 30S ribosomal protein S1 [Desulfobacula sp.]MBT3806580.1 30S ribosomal protein S1 [Desulfobacula sp.]MBT4026924.1 30S ribosomal protein S1 [Desulfobacula sp.]MBT4200704.1 30S ribosomal protein S1 [Desulfobacula sp.]
MTDPIDDNANGNNGESKEEKSFAELFESYDTKMSHELNQGDKVEGEIISIGDKSVYIDTGTKSDGVVAKAELLDEKGEFLYKIGDKVNLYVVSLSESEIILSKALSGAGKASMLDDASRNGTPVEGKVTGVIKGGFSVDIMGKRAFCPVSQIDVKYVENQEEYLGQTHHFLITRFEEGGRNIVVSRRDLLNEEIKEKSKEYFKKVEEGDVVQGTITKLMSYGAFIELIPGVEGMAHISELSWSRIEKPEEVLQPGDVVNVKVLKIEPSNQSGTFKISLSMKQTSSNPWDSMESSFNTGDQVSGKVVRLTSFGAFVEIVPGVDGLVHISEMSHTKRVLKPDDVVLVGENVQVVIKSIDMDSKRISLSIKDALGDPWTGASAKYEINSIVEGHLEKREKFGLFITLEPGVTGLMPSSNISKAANASDFEKLKPGSSVQVMIQEVDEERRRITLTSSDQKESDNWKQFANSKKTTPLGTMESLFLEAMKKKK